MVSLNASGAGCPLTNARGLIFSSDYWGELFLSKAQEGRCGDRTQVHLAPSFSVRLQGHNKADTCQIPWQENLLYN